MVSGLGSRAKGVLAAGTGPLRGAPLARIAVWGPEAALVGRGVGVGVDVDVGVA